MVTGASSGIGEDAARAFARRGATILAVARRRERLESLVRECRPAAPASDFLAGDLGDRTFAEGMVREALSRHGRIDVLVNNAAMPKHKPVFETSPEEVERVLRVNFLSAVWTTLAALPSMLERDAGTIVNVGSFAGRVVPPREAVYAASKAALAAFSEGLGHDLAASGVHVALVVPGAIDTEIWDKRDEQTGYRGPRHPPGLVTEAIFEAIERRRSEVRVPRRSASLTLAGWLRFVAPGLLRRAMRRFDPVEIPREGSGRERE